MNEIDTYIQEKSPQIQEVLNTVRTLILKTLPDVQEVLSWGMPTYKTKHNIIHFAPAKNHLGIYPGAETVEYFSPRLKEMKLKFSKGAIQFPYNKEISYDFIKEIIQKAYEFNNQ
ncbi:MAG: DUF1801 domain-containing protein [Erysipelotrichaceae bacterium]|nr:DUF1801 domain-containing protein [Erysipelotrichaceae bacterium]MDY6034432.1 DUF1801 domain-containing protein [Bulleidia sp.]